MMSNSLSRNLANVRRTAITLTALFAIALLASLLFAAQPAFADDTLAAGTTNTQPDQTTAETNQATPAKKGSKYAKVIGVTLDRKAAKIKNAKTVQFTATLVTDDSTKKLKKKDQAITWSVSKPKIARISQDGVVQAKRTGTVKVIATTRNGMKAKATVKVVVQKKKTAEAVPILVYHRISTDKGKKRFRSGDSLAISATNFKRQMRWLSKHGYTTISTEELREWRVEKAFLPKKSVLITIDDGFYETYYVGLPILKKYNLKATSFVIGEAVRVKLKEFRESRAWEFVGRDTIKKVRKEYPNLEFQSHTYDMHHRASSGYGVATSWSRSQIKADFRRNKKFGFTALAYPYGHTSSNMYSVIREDKDINIAFGYAMDWAATRKSPLYNMPRMKVMGNGSLTDFVRLVKKAR